MKFKIQPMDINCLQENNLLNKERIQKNINELCKLGEKFINKYDGLNKMYYDHPKLSIESPIGAISNPGDFKTSHGERKVKLSSNKTLFEDGVLIMSVSKKLFRNLQLTLDSDSIKTYKLICKHMLWDADGDHGGELNSPYIIVESDSNRSKVVVYGSYSQGNKQGPEIYENSHFMEWVNWNTNTCTRYASENPTASNNLEKKKMYITEDQFVELSGVIRGGLFLSSGRIPVGGAIHDLDTVVSEFKGDVLHGRFYACCNDNSVFSTNKFNIKGTLSNGQFHGDVIIYKQGIETTFEYDRGTLRRKQNTKMVLEVFTKKENKDISSIHYISNDDGSIKTKTTNYRHGNSLTMPVTSSTASIKAIECGAMDYNRFHSIVSKIK